METKDFTKLKVAIVHDWAWSMRGAERCVEAFCELFPQADVFMLFGDPAKLSPKIRKHTIYFSFLQRIPFVRKFFRYGYFMYPYAIESFDFNGYDLVISSSSCVAKGVVTPLNSVNFCYMYTPMRYGWDQSSEYFNAKNFSWWKRLVIPFFLKSLREWDFVSTSRVDYLVTISNYITKRINKYYRREVDAVVYPPVDLAKCINTTKKENFFVSIAPYEPNKGGRLMIDFAIETGINLVIIGEGSLKKELVKRAQGYDNIEFVGWLPEKEKFDCLARAKGYLFFGVEDFGITVVEAIASGTPVMAFAQGGALETVIDGKTGVLFDRQDLVSIKEALNRFEIKTQQKVFNVKEMRKFADKFSLENFNTNITKEIVKAISKQ